MSTHENANPANPRGARLRLSYWLRTMRLVWAAAPRWTSVWMILLIVQGAVPAASLYLIKLMVDSLLKAAASGGDWQQIRPALIWVALVAAVTLISEVMQSLIEWIRTAQSELIQDHIKGLVHQQSISVDLSFYESADYQDLLERARNEAGSRPLALLESCGSLIQNGITLAAIAALLLSYSLWLPVILLLSTLPAFYVVLRYDQRYHQWWNEKATERRWIHYYDVMLSDSLAAPELRLFHLGPHFQTVYKSLRQRLRNERLSQLRRQSLAKLVAGVGVLGVTGGVMSWMLWRALHGLNTLGDVALFYQAFNKGQGLMRSLLASMGQIYTNTLFMGNLFAFLDVRPEIADLPGAVAAPTVIRQGIEFRNVTFAYPGSQKPALQNFSLFIPAGKVVAIVGPNGAGKSTLLKLLCRFYDPQSGSIEIDGRDIREMAVSDLRQQLTVLFQFPLNFYASAGQSISFGDIESQPTAAEIETAARNAGIHELISRLPKGYDTTLGKYFAGGAELSGGEWQRLATARAYLRKSPAIILDEPTSFLDSWAENDWFERFRNLARGRTGILITHRFTIARRADIIHVMQDGEIRESGSHEELVNEGRLYARSWAAQLESTANPNLLSSSKLSAVNPEAVLEEACS
jgi:ATP-binding cassette, subfamily B, bacterial